MKEHMEQYIKRTKIDSPAKQQYEIRVGELVELYRILDGQPYEALMLAFRYGFAKGVRMIRAEARNGKVH